MSEQLLQEARTVAKSRRNQVNDALRKALNMHLIRVGDEIPGGIQGVGAMLAEESHPTYRMEGVAHAALNQVRFQPGRSRM